MQGRVFEKYHQIPEGIREGSDSDRASAVSSGLL
jgi:hypothetical protein